MRTLRRVIVEKTKTPLTRVIVEAYGRKQPGKQAQAAKRNEKPGNGGPLRGVRPGSTASITRAGARLSGEILNKAFPPSEERGRAGRGGRSKGGGLRTGRGRTVVTTGGAPGRESGEHIRKTRQSIRDRHEDSREEAKRGRDSTT